MPALGHRLPMTAKTSMEIRAMSGKIGRPLVRPSTIPDQDTSMASSPVFAENYPSLYGFVSKDRKSENFHARGSFTVFWEDGVFKVNLNDRPNGLSTFVSSPELACALRIADSGIRSGTLRWRVNKQYRARSKEVYN